VAVAASGDGGRPTSPGRRCRSSRAASAQAGTRVGTGGLANGRRSESQAGSDCEEGATVAAVGRRPVLLYPRLGPGTWSP